MRIGERLPALEGRLAENASVFENFCPNLYHDKIIPRFAPKSNPFLRERSDFFRRGEIVVDKRAEKGYNNLQGRPDRVFRIRKSRRS